MSGMTTHTILRSPDAENQAGGGHSSSLTAEQARAKAEKHVTEAVSSAGVRGAAAEALISNAAGALANMNPFRSLLNMGAEAIISHHCERIGNTQLSQVTEAMRQVLGAGIDELVKGVRAKTSKDSSELFACFSSALTLSGVQGLYSNFGAINKFHDLEGQSAAMLKVCAPTFTMTPTVENNEPGLKLEEGGRTGFYPLRIFLDQADALANLAANPQTQIIGSLASCQQRGLLLAILSYASKIPGILNPRHSYAGLKDCDASWTEETTKQVSDLYNALDEKWRPMYGDGRHQILLAT